VTRGIKVPSQRLLLFINLVFSRQFALDDLKPEGLFMTNYKREIKNLKESA
jgi:hypothetical protein